MIILPKAHFSISVLIKTKSKASRRKPLNTKSQNINMKKIYL
jgi:hypothetical protein